MALSSGSKGFLAVFIVVLVVAAGAVVFLVTGTSEEQASAEGRTVEVEIPEGASASQIADLLAEEGVIGSPLAFKLLARFDDRVSRLQAGTYELEGGMSVGEVMEVLSEGPPPPDSFRVTIPEGWTVEQILERLAEAGPFDVDELEAALEAMTPPEWVPVDELPPEAVVFEGLLFPDTYDFLADASAEEVLSRLVAETEKALDEVTPPEGMSRYDVLTIASLVEREARISDDQPLISSVIHNRLAEGMRLQVDATVLYARGEHTDRVLFEDLEVESPWNTYLHDGLPPTPVASPGRGAIRAAADPPDSGYLYYVVEDIDTGAHAFAETPEEHNRNVQEFRRKRAEAGGG